MVSRSDSTRAAGNTITTLSTYAGDSSLVLDAAGNPVVAYRDALDQRLKILHCNDPNCLGGDESLTAPDVQKGQWPSLTLDPAGNPMVSYYTTVFDRMKFLHCDDPNCAGFGDTPQTPDPGAFLVESQTSLAVDASGNPVIAYAKDRQEIRVMHCNDPNCAGGDESITMHDSMSDAPSIALDASGNPVVAYYHYSSLIVTGSLRVMHCNDPDCAGGDDPVNSPDPGTGITPSLRLDAGGNPVIAYYSGSDTGDTRDLKIMHCNDALCAGQNESITVPDSLGDVGSQPALLLAGGNPVVTYRDETNGDLRLLRCNDPSCGPGGETFVALDTPSDSGKNSSPTLDASGFPAITYDAGPDLKLLRCGDPVCLAAVGGIAGLPAVHGPPAGDGRAFLAIAALTAIAAAAVAFAAAAGLRRRRRAR